jgi:hypothetical protein
MQLLFEFENHLMATLISKILGHLKKDFFLDNFLTKSRTVISICQLSRQSITDITNSTQKADHQTTGAYVSK